MKANTATHGATLILVVLLTLLLMVVVLAATMRLGLASRQTTGDQKAILQAQYRAESEVNLTRSKLKDLQGMLSNSQITNPETGKKEDVLRVPNNTTLKQLRLYAAQFCGATEYNTANWKDGTAFSPRKPDGRVSLPQTVTCEPNANSTLSNQFQVLVDAVNPLAYGPLDPKEKTGDMAVEANRLKFWNDLLRKSSNSLTTDNTKLKLKPVRVVYFAPEARFRFYIAVDSMSAKGVDAASTRVLTARSDANSGIWWFELALPSLSKDVLRTNHHRSYAAKNSATPTINFNDQVFEGSVHTNEKFLFSSNATATFKGPVTSAGCTDLPDNTPQDMQCSQEAGVYIAGDPYTSNAASVKERNSAILSSINDKTNVVFDSDANGTVDDKDEKPDFTAPYVPMPLNALSQLNAAQGKDSDGTPLPGGQKGIMVDGSYPGVYVFAGGRDEKTLSTYDDASGKWQEPSPVYQYITTYSLKENTKEEYKSNWVTDDTPIYDWRGWLRYYKSGTKYNNWPSSQKGTGTDEDGYTRYYIHPLVSSTTYTQDKIGRQYRIDKDGNLYEKTSSGWPTTPSGKFNGVVFGDSIQKLFGPSRVASSVSDKTVDEAPPALASFSQMNFSAQNDINISSDLTVADTPCTYLQTSCTKEPKNIMGIFSQSGNVTITKDAPDNINIHSALLTSEGEVTVEGYDVGASRGNVTMIGSVTENWYGAFGTFNPKTNQPSTGYGRTFTYDKRLQQGMSPPYWPVPPKWIATNASGNVGLDQIITKQGSQSDF